MNKPVEFSSSAIKKALYTEKTKVLSLWFTDGDFFRYANVPEDIYKGLLNDKSKGGFFNAFIRDDYKRA